MEDTFKEYEGSRLWEAVSCVIADLESNEDIELHLSLIHISEPTRL